MINLIHWLLLLTTFIVLLVARKKCNSNVVLLSVRGRIILALIIFVTIGFNTIGLGWAYFQYYHQDDKYLAMQQSVNYHLYKPLVLPGGRKADTAFTLYDKTYPGNNAVRIVYATPMSLEKLQQNQSNKLIIFVQGEVNPGFDVQTLAQSEVNGTKTMREVTLPNFPIKQAFAIEGGITTTLYVLTTDNVLLQLVALNEPAATLIEMAESMQ